MTGVNNQFMANTDEGNYFLLTNNLPNNLKLLMVQSSQNADKHTDRDFTRAQRPPPLPWTATI